MFYKTIERSDYYTDIPVGSNIRDFQTCVEELNLADMHSEEMYYTWSNKRKEGYIAKKFDRIMVDAHWLDVFNDITTEFLPLDFSDHYARLLKFHAIHFSKRGFFKFFNFLAKHRDFLQVVNDSWDATIVQGVQIYALLKS